MSTSVDVSPGTALLPCTEQAWILQSLRCYFRHVRLLTCDGSSVCLCACVCGEKERVSGIFVVFLSPCVIKISPNPAPTTTTFSPLSLFVTSQEVFPFSVVRGAKEEGGTQRTYLHRRHDFLLWTTFQVGRRLSSYRRGRCDSIQTKCRKHRRCSAVLPLILWMRIVFILPV